MLFFLTFYSSNNPEKIKVSTKILSNATVFNIYKTFFLNTKSGVGLQAAENIVSPFQE